MRWFRRRRQVQPIVAYLSDWLRVTVHPDAPSPWSRIIVEFPKTSHPPVKLSRGDAGEMATALRIAEQLAKKAWTESI